MEKGDLEFLSQLVDSIQEAGDKLEKAYDKKDYEKFDKTKKFILQIQRKISEVLKWFKKEIFWMHWKILS